MKNTCKIMLFFFCILPFTGYSQINWMNSLELGKAVAESNDKLLLVDFWASWCGPCKTMDRELWSQPEIAEAIKKTVPVKIDVDVYREIAKKYNSSSIPMVLLIDASGDVLWKKTGYSSNKPFKDMLSQVPTNVSNLNQSLKVVQESPEDPQGLLNAGLSYQQLGREMDGDLSDDFLAKSSAYFKKYSKESTSETEILQAQLQIIFNDALRGNSKKALKKLAKLDGEGNHEIEQMSSFVGAYCYKCMGDKKNYELMASKVKEDKYLDILKD